MTPEALREEALFQAAVHLMGSERSRFLDRECKGEAALQKRVEALLAANALDDSFLAERTQESPSPLKREWSDIADEAVGQRIGRYILLEKIGEGGCGVVYVAQQTEPIHRQVALKVIKLGMDTKQVVARFETERQVLALMDHPNIAKVLDAGATDKGSPYFVMELVRGIRITEYCDQRRLPTRERLDLFIRVCQAIQHAHQKGIIHRDIKPSNILVTVEDSVAVPKVIDFGIAKATQGRLPNATIYTELHQFVGTPAYMSPEQANMSELDIDTRSDIYSLGVLLYELLTGKTPFESGDLMASGFDAMRRTIREDEPTRPSIKLASLQREELTTATQRHSSDLAVLMRLLRGELDWIVMKCLEKDRTRRYETANGVAADLRRHLNNELVVARPPNAVYRIQKAWRRNKLIFAAGAVVTAALVIGLGVSIMALRKAQWDRERAMTAEQNQSFARRQAEEAGQAATRERERAEAELWNSRLSEAKALRFAGGPGARLDGAALIHELSRRPHLSEVQVLALRREAIGQLALVDIAVPTNWVSKPSWHPMGWDSKLRRFARSKSSNRLELCEFPSERLLGSFSVPPPGIPHQTLFTPDDKFLVVRLEDPAGHFFAWRVDSPRRVVLHREGIDHIDVSPDSQSVILLTFNGVVVQALSDTIPGRSLQSTRRAITAVFSPDMRQIAVVPIDAATTVELWDAVSGETQFRFAVDFSPNRIAWAPDGARIAVGGDNGKLELRTVRTAPLGTYHATAPLALHGHQGYVDRLRFTPDGSLLMSDSWDQSRFVWDLVSGGPLLRETRFGLSTSTPGGRTVALKEWPMGESVAELIPRTGYRTVAWAGTARAALGVWISPDARLVAVSYPPTNTGTEGECLLVDFSQGREIARVKGIWAQFSMDSRTLFTFEAYQEKRVQSYDVSQEALANPPPSWQKGTEIYHGQAGEKINTGTFAADGHTLVIAATDSVIFLDVLGQQPPRTWAQPAHFVSPSHDGHWISTVLHGQHPVLWNRRVQQAAFRAEPYGQIRISPDDRWFAVTTHRTVQIHALESLQPASAALTLEVPGSPPVAFSPDSRMFAVPLNRTHLRLYETASGRELATLSPPTPGPIRGPEALTFSVDGQWLLAAKDDGETVAWNLSAIRTELAKLHLDWSFAVGAEN